MSSFDARIAVFFDELFALDPLQATEAGEHRHDGRWPNLTEAGRTGRLAFADRWAAELGGRGGLGDELTGDERIDRDLLLSHLDAIRFAETELRDECWDPLAWVYLLGGGLFPLLAREYAPLGARLGSVTGRLEGMPAVVAAAIASLRGQDGRPVSRFHTETALRQFDGVTELIDDALAQADAAVAAGEAAVESLRPRLATAATAAKDALAELERHLRDVVLPASEGEGRLGGELFAAKMRHTLRSETPSPAAILERAEREYVAVRAEMVRLADALWPTWCPDRPRPAIDAGDPETEADLVRGVLDAIAADHPPATELLDFCRAELGRIEDFCRERDLVGLATDPLDIRWTPVFLRSFGGAMLDSPGPLDTGQKSFFSITPIPEDWNADQAESYLREQNTRQLRLLTIHEAVPGHYLQGVYANRCTSLARSVLWSGVFAEGWAVYVTQVMMDVGYGADDPALLLVHWKFYLRAAINAIIDVRIHTAGMTEEDAVALMVEGGFQEASEARNKYNRARLSSTQLSTYFIGSMAMWDIEVERRRRLAAASGDPRGAAAVRPRDLPGGLGETPGFRYREHLETIMGHGSPPPPLLARLVLGEADAVPS